MNQPKSVADLAGKTKNDMKFDQEVRGIDLETAETIDELLESFATTGFQATHVHRAVQEIRRMRNANAKIYVGCTSNMMSCGVRECLKYMAKHRLFDVLVVTGGGVEEDLIKCLKPTYIADFGIDGQTLRENGWNRIGNLAISNDNYACFETWFNEAVDELVCGVPDGECDEKSAVITTPSKFIRHLGKKINNEDSVMYWCYKNDIHVYSPAMTDGSMGDLLTFYRKRHALKLDMVEDVFLMNTECLSGRENGAIVLGGGVVKHHVLNGNLFNDGLDYCVLVNTAQEFDGSDAGASLNEAYSWGKVKSGRTCVKVHGDASVVFPLIAYGAFRAKSTQQ